MIAFLENVAFRVGPAARWIHQGLTSSDLLDTTLAIQMNMACAIQRLMQTRERIRVGKLSGAVGTHAPRSTNTSATSTRNSVLPALNDRRPGRREG